jgi:hypothetical protein
MVKKIVVDVVVPQNLCTYFKNEGNGKKNLNMLKVRRERLLV